MLLTIYLQSFPQDLTFAMDSEIEYVAAPLELPLLVAALEIALLVVPLEVAHYPETLLGTDIPA